MTAFARAARKSQKRFGGALEPFNRLQIRFRDRRGELVSLAGAEIEHSRPALRADYDRIARASYLTELANEATREREPQPDLFDLLDGGFDVLASDVWRDGDASRRDGWLAAYEMKLLVLAGYRPRLDACAECGLEKNRYRFRPREGSVLCLECAGDDGIPVSSGTTRLLEASLETGIEELAEFCAFTAIQVEEARRMLAVFIQWQLGKELKSTRFF
jgi:DNA repair protein RecO (recombination protein O)